MAERPSLRARLLLNLAVPMLGIVGLGALISYFLVSHYVDRTYDLWLLDSAESLAHSLQDRYDPADFSLSHTAVAVLRWDAVDQTFFKVQAQGKLLAGDVAVPDPPVGWVAPWFFDSQIHGQTVRVVATQRGPFQVLVAETLNKRRMMRDEIWLVVLVPQLVLLAVAGVQFWVGIRLGLKPLRSLAAYLGQRSASSLEPIPHQEIPVEIRFLTEAVNGLLQRLASALAAQQRFIANAAHQLRTPLAGLKLQLDLARQTGEPIPMDQIDRAVGRAAHLVHQLLILARSESRDCAQARFAPVDLRALAEESCLEWAPRIVAHAMEIAFQAPPDPVTVTGDAALLRELLSNLLDNAVRYGKRTVWVSLESGPPRLAVEDDGPGFPAAELERVGERFYRIPGSPGEGCGLGLAIVKEVAVLHGAKVRIGKGRQGARVEIAWELKGF
ncbi:sensor histidine kinase [Methylothermus subterraneus]